MLRRLLFGLLLIATNSCGHVAVYDTEVIADLGSAGGYGVHTLTDQTRDISKAAWDKERVGYLCMSSTAFNDTETAIDQLCKEFSGVCDYQTREAIAQAFFRVNHAVNKARRAK